MIELTSGVISVCLPTFWPLIVHVSNAYTKYISARSSSKITNEDVDLSHDIVTIGGGKIRGVGSPGGSGSDDKDTIVLAIEETPLSKHSTDSQDDDSLDRPFGLSTPEFRV